LNVYVDANFVLEMVLHQEQFHPAQQIQFLAETGRIALVGPLLSLAEPFSNIGYRRVERARLRDEVRKHSEQLARSAEHFQAVEKMSDLLKYFESLDEAETVALERIATKVLRHTRQLGFDEETLALAMDFRRDYDLRLQDASVVSSIYLDLRAAEKSGTLEESIFVSRDAKAFNNVKPELSRLQCSYIASFEDGLKRIEAFLRRVSQSGE
jgi:hypothetical protein